MRVAAAQLAGFTPWNLILHPRYYDNRAQLVHTINDIRKAPNLVGVLGCYWTDETALAATILAAYAVPVVTFTSATATPDFRSELATSAVAQAARATSIITTRFP